VCLLCGTSWVFSTLAAPLSHPAFDTCGAPQISVVLRSHMYRHSLSGTQWCGNGNRARDAQDLGLFKKTDDCCRTHDNCPDNIPARHSRHGLNNSGLFTRWAAQFKTGKGNYFRGSSGTDRRQTWHHNLKTCEHWGRASVHWQMCRCFLGCPVETRTSRFVDLWSKEITWTLQSDLWIELGVWTCASWSQIHKTIEISTVKVHFVG